MFSLKGAAKSFFKNYVGFLIGLIFGATVATLTSYFILGPPKIKQENLSDIDRFMECLVDE